MLESGISGTGGGVTMTPNAGYELRREAPSVVVRALALRQRRNPAWPHRRPSQRARRIRRLTRGNSLTPAVLRWDAQVAERTKRSTAHLRETNFAVLSRRISSHLTAESKGPSRMVQDKSAARAQAGRHGRRGADNPAERYGGRRPAQRDGGGSHDTYRHFALPLWSRGRAKWRSYVTASDRSRLPSSRRL